MQWRRFTVQSYDSASLQQFQSGTLNYSYNSFIFDNVKVGLIMKSYMS